MTYFENLVAMVPRDRRACCFALGDRAMGAVMMQASLGGKRMIFGGFAAEIEA
jgi:uncharacterized protein YbaA (DUF1428 family)